MKDLRQSPAWARFLGSIGWEIRKVGRDQAAVKRIPLLNCSVIKIQRPTNPINFSLIDKLAKENKALFVVIEPSSENKEDGFLKNGFRLAKGMSLIHTKTIRISLSLTLEQIRSSFSENARRNIKKAINNQLSTRVFNLNETENDHEFRKFYSLLENLKRLKKFWLPDYSEFYRKMQAFKDSSYIILAYSGKRVVAGLWLGIYDQQSWYMHTGITQKGYDLLANYLLVWEAVQLSKKLGLKTFDFEGLYDPRFPKERRSWQKFSGFKSRFHGDIVEFPYPYIKCYNPLFKIFYFFSKHIP